MSDTDTTSRQPWQAFWQGEAGRAASTSHGARDPALLNHWQQFFASQTEALTGAKLVDMGCGDGALTRLAQIAAADLQPSPQYFCVDNSAAAIAQIERELSDVTAICADLGDTTIADASADFVLSQFGLEYAGISAAAEVGRLLKPGGLFAAILHLRDGAIDRECSAAASALNATLDSNVFAAMSELFLASRELRYGRGSTVAFELADRALNPCVQTVKQVLLDQGPEAAAGTVYRCYTDIAHMYKNINAFDPQEVVEWAQRVELEMLNYAMRMAAMSTAALDEAGLAEFCAALEQSDIVLEPPQTLSMGEPPSPAAWYVQGRKSNA